MKVFKYVIYILALLSLVALAYQIYTNFAQISIGFNEFAFDMKPAEDYVPMSMSAGQIVLCVLAALMFVFGSIVYIGNMSNLGYQPMQLVHFIITSVGCLMTVGMYYFSIFLKGNGFWSADNKVVRIIQIIGCVVLLAELIFLVIQKTLRAVPLWIIYLILGYLVTVLVVAIVQIVIYLIAFAVICIVALSLGNGKKRIVDKDGNVYEEV